MPGTVRCPHCGAKLQYKTPTPPARGKCPKCQQNFDTSSPGVERQLAEVKKQVELERLGLVNRSRPASAAPPTQASGATPPPREEPAPQRPHDGAPTTPLQPKRDRSPAAPPTTPRPTMLERRAGMDGAAAPVLVVILVFFSAVGGIAAGTEYPEHRLAIVAITILLVSCEVFGVTAAVYPQHRGTLVGCLLASASGVFFFLAVWHARDYVPRLSAEIGAAFPWLVPAVVLSVPAVVLLLRRRK